MPIVTQLSHIRRQVLVFVCLLSQLTTHAASDAGAAAERSPPAGLAVTVYCGASGRVDQKFIIAGTQLGEGLGRRKWTLVYGGTPAGLMGSVARAVKGNGGRVVGVVPDIFKDDLDKQADELVMVASMHDRKNVMQRRADVFVVLPGGAGTLDELADTLELKKLGELKQPIIILNQDGYYDDLLRFFDRIMADKFTRSPLGEQFLVVRTVGEVFEQLEQIKR